LILWPEGIQYLKVLLFLSDAAAYMKLAGKTLRNIFPKLIHLTCMAHALHNVCEKIIAMYGSVNRLVSCGKKIFVKSQNRRELFKEKCGDIPLPPQPVKTRWGSWLNAVEYYAKYYASFRDFVNLLDSEESISIEELKDLFGESSIESDLVYSCANFNCLAKVIKKLETEDMLLLNSLDLVQSVLNQLQKSKGKPSELALEKFLNVLYKNKGYKIIKSINDVLNGVPGTQLELHLSPEEIASFKFSPITNCDVERSFSRYKNILGDRRLSFEENNLKYYFISYCNAKYLR